MLRPNFLALTVVANTRDANKSEYRAYCHDGRSTLSLNITIIPEQLCLIIENMGISWRDFLI